MPIITLTMTWMESWRLEINGRAKFIDMSSHKFVRQGTGCQEAWVLTEIQEPLLGFSAGARLEKPPMTLAAQILEILEGKGYHVSTSHSKTWVKSNGWAVTMDVWTLKYAPSSQITA